MFLVAACGLLLLAIAAALTSMEAAVAVRFLLLLLSSLSGCLMFCVLPYRQVLQLYTRTKSNHKRRERLRSWEPPAPDGTSLCVVLLLRELCRCKLNFLIIFANSLICLALGVMMSTILKELQTGTSMRGAGTCCNFAYF